MYIIRSTSISVLISNVKKVGSFKMSGFQVYSAQSSEGGDKGTVDFEALNSYVVETAGLQDTETLVGYVSGIYDLGTQSIPDAEYKVDKGDEDLTIGELTDKYQEKIDNGEITKFAIAYDIDTKSNIIKKFVPQKDRQAVVYSVDFPDIMLDKAPFFGAESNPQPLRLYYGGEWWDKPTQKMIVSSVIPLKKTKDDKVGWTMHPLSQLYKMAVASKIVTKEQPFLPEMIDQLLGKSLQFKAQVFFNEKDGKKYYNERLNFVGALARGQVEVEAGKTSLIMFHAENDEVELRELRKHVINTMARAKNFSGSPIEAQLVKLGRITEQDSIAEEGEGEVQESTAQTKVDAANNAPTEDVGW